MNDRNYIPLGIPAPEGPQETEEASTPDGMRRAILRGARDSALVRNVMYRADFAGLSGEDRYVAMAYNALVQLEALWRSTLDYRWKWTTPTATSANKEA